MKRALLINCFLLLTFSCLANSILVKNIDELNKANKEAKPGDIIYLQNGEWSNVTISLNCKGTKEQPITFKAQTAGKVLITGKSKLTIGGNFLIVDGLYFMNGFAGNDAIIKFRIDKDQIGNNCRVTNTVINNFNNPKRLDENYWVALYGKNNRIDHCSFLNKKNMGVLMAVILDDDRSRENFHSIDHNYFGQRLPLASNTGETIRVGVSEHCEFNSNTQIADNFFENCDGETEIISIKSGRNIIRNNLFKECQGSVVLRHGDNNTVENNVFLGNNKEGTGGVRVINKGQWVINNFFYKCRGVGFRSPLSIMNGVPNSPANRYVAVTDAVIANNSYFECAPLGFCIGSDTERSVTPSNVYFGNNISYNSSSDPVYITYDDINGINFDNNLVNNTSKQNLVKGFIKASFIIEKTNLITAKNSGTIGNTHIGDSLLIESRSRLSGPLTGKPGFTDEKLLEKIKVNAETNCGAGWFEKKNFVLVKKQITADCKTAEDIIRQIAKHPNEKLNINLTGKDYSFNQPLNITTDVFITTAQKTKITFSTSVLEYLFQIVAGNSLSLKNLDLDLASVSSTSFISTDTSGSSNHSNFRMANCRIVNLSGNFFHAAKTSVSDSIMINHCTFADTKGILFNFNSESDKKGYYNVEKLKILNNTINNHEGQILGMLRTGNDESTMGPLLNFCNNKIQDSKTLTDDALIHLYGTQRSLIEKNQFINCNPTSVLILYDDIVRADHIFKNNSLNKSGKVQENEFVISENNHTQ